MQAQLDILLALLDKTKDDSISYDELSKAVRVTDEVFHNFLDDLISSKIVDEKGALIKASLEQRLNLALKAVSLGADLERVGRLLGWLEFEEMVAHIFEENGFHVSSRFRFNAEGRRWEIDVLAKRRPLLVCAECKHWSKEFGNVTARRIIETHLSKVRVLSENVNSIKRLPLRNWSKAIFVPVALSLQPSKGRFYRRIPIVSIFELPSFLNEFEGQLEWLASFSVDFT